METFKLAGHSGCALEVEKRGSTYVVIKTSRDKAYNLRLKRQAQKQKAFVHHSLRAPKVINSGYNKGGLFAFSMEYVNGFTLAEYLRSANAADIPAIADQLLDFIPETFSFDAGAVQAHQAKLAELTPKMPADKNIHQALARLKRYPWHYSALSYCHGDLSLENIIWSNGELYLIDFLDSYYDSWMQDFGKILFDLESLWSYRHSTIDENLRTRLSILKSALLQKLRAIPHGEKLVKEVYHLALLQALRILPYAHDETTKKHLISSVNRLQEVLDSL